MFRLPILQVFHIQSRLNGLRLLAWKCITEPFDVIFQLALDLLQRGLPDLQLTFTGALFLHTGLLRLVARNQVPGASHNKKA